jgi:hypothetical protein
MLRNLSKEVHRRTRADPTLPRIGAIGLAVAVGIAYFVAAQLSLALLGKPMASPCSGLRPACPPAF